MGHDVRASGWANYFARVQEEHSRIRVVSDTLYLIAEYAYYHETLANDDVDLLLSFLVAHHSQRLGHRTAADRKSNEARIRQQLRRNRMQAKARQAGLGANSVRAEIESPLED